MIDRAFLLNKTEIQNARCNRRNNQKPIGQKELTRSWRLPDCGKKMVGYKRIIKRQDFGGFYHNNFMKRFEKNRLRMHEAKI